MIKTKKEVITKTSAIEKAKKQAIEKAKKLTTSKNTIIKKNIKNQVYINPDTGRIIKFGTKKFNELVKEGKISLNSFSKSTIKSIKPIKFIQQQTPQKYQQLQLQLQLLQEQQKQLQEDRKLLQQDQQEQKKQQKQIQLEQIQRERQLLQEQQEQQQKQIQLEQQKQIQLDRQLLLEQQQQQQQELQLYQQQQQELQKIEQQKQIEQLEQQKQQLEHKKQLLKLKQPIILPNYQQQLLQEQQRQLQQERIFQQQQQEQEVKIQQERILLQQQQQEQQLKLQQQQEQELRRQQQEGQLQIQQNRQLLQQQEQEQLRQLKQQHQQQQQRQQQEIQFEHQRKQLQIQQQKEEMERQTQRLQLQLHKELLEQQRQPNQPNQPNQQSPIIELLQLQLHQQLLEQQRQDNQPNPPLPYNHPPMILRNQKPYVLVPNPPSKKTPVKTSKSRNFKSNSSPIIHKKQKYKERNWFEHLRGKKLELLSPSPTSKINEYLYKKSLILPIEKRKEFIKWATGIPGEPTGEPLYNIEPPNNSIPDSTTLFNKEWYKWLWGKDISDIYKKVILTSDILKTRLIEQEIINDEINRINKLISEEKNNNPNIVPSTQIFLEPAIKKLDKINLSIIEAEYNLEIARALVEKEKNEQLKKNLLTSLQTRPAPPYKYVPLKLSSKPLSPQINTSIHPELKTPRRPALLSSKNASYLIKLTKQQLGKAIKISKNINEKFNVVNKNKSEIINIKQPYLKLSSSLELFTNIAKNIADTNKYFYQQMIIVCQYFTNPYSYKYSIQQIKLFKNNRKEKINNYIKLFEKEVKNNKDRKRLLQELEEDEKKNDEEVNIIVDKFNEILRSHYIKDLNFFWRFFN
jgi:hypothetical protein